MQTMTQHALSEAHLLLTIPLNVSLLVKRRLLQTCNHMLTQIPLLVYIYLSPKQSRVSCCKCMMRLSERRERENGMGREGRHGYTLWLAQECLSHSSVPFHHPCTCRPGCACHVTGGWLKGKLMLKHYNNVHTHTTLRTALWVSQTTELPCIGCSNEIAQ